MSARRVEVHPDALIEADAALTWYAERSTRAPGAFLAEIQQAIASIAEAPRRWPILEGDCRKFSLFRFPYLIVYREKTADLIQVVAVAHGRRKPGYWRDRIG